MMNPIKKLLLKREAYKQLKLLSIYKKYKINLTEDIANAKKFFAYWPEDKQINFIENSDKTDLVILASSTDLSCLPHHMLLKIIKLCPEIIKKIKSPSYECLALAINKDPKLLYDIKNVPESIQLEAIKQNRAVIKYIKKPSYYIQKKIIENDPENIFLILNLNKQIIKDLIKKDISYIRYYKNPPYSVQLKAIEYNPLLIQKIKKPHRNIIKLALQKNPESIRFIKKQNTAMHMIVLNHKNYNTNLNIWIVKPNKKIQLLMVEKDPNYISKINNPCKKIQIQAAKHIDILYETITEPEAIEAFSKRSLMRQACL